MGSPECGVQHVWGVAATASPEEAECGFVITVWGLVSNCLLGDHEAGGSVQHHVRVWTLCLLGGSLCYTALKGAGWRLWELCGAQPVQLNVVVLVLGLIMVVCCNSLSVDVLAAAGGLWWLLPPSPVSALQSYPSSSPFSPQPAARVYRCPPAVQGPGPAGAVVAEGSHQPYSPSGGLAQLDTTVGTKRPQGAAGREAGMQAGARASRLRMGLLATCRNWGRLRPSPPSWGA